jgi:polysaccharide export outer membrane protein
MFSDNRMRSVIFLIGLLAVSSASSGCLARHAMPDNAAVPTELTKITLPDHVIAPPDILLIDAVTLVPRPPYLIKPLDALAIQVRMPGVKDDDKRSSLVPGQPIDGVYRVEPDGNVNLGFDYGLVKISGLQIPNAKDAIKAHLLKRFKADFDVTVSLVESRAMQQIRGEHLVQPDGKIVLGTYGTVNVTGLTLDQARTVIQDHLSRFLLDPELSVDIGGFNSRVYYVIFDLCGAGQQVYRLPVTGNETVIDAVAELKGLPGGTHRKRIWVARPTAAEADGCQVMPVNWDAIASCGATATNYQLMPGDRVYVAVDPWIATDQFLAKVISPIERLFGIALLANSTVRAYGPNGGNGISGR